MPIPVEVDGKTYEEMHVDGGATPSYSSGRRRSPWEEAAGLGDRPLAGSNLYVIVAGKLFADPEPGGAASSCRSWQTRCRPGSAPRPAADLVRLHAVAREAGMNYRLAAIPAAVPASPDPMSFDPVDGPPVRGRPAAGRLARPVARPTRRAAGRSEEVPDRGGTRLVPVPPG